MTANAKEPPASGQPKARRGEAGDLTPLDLAGPDLDPATSAAEEEDEAQLPEQLFDMAEETTG